ncbi:hypothetical protein CCR83_05290 [Rhodobacter veldkampii DSM 11550]|uniref:Cytochrome C n=1 Tax=Phaeovulum veldkampii DSM 11550 TaxID=1185920 RepID=A0A2T4JKQ7_9RHOB|nr:c-type cytochrome [Phaeovulum veldkampii]MBK5945880.1 hypothetical protein [Phaeovulum veldkampii DSM 11550]PTE18462.1 cytochrome C [Phaeovulum veldkampii DSM 11550]TDQ59347.1 cytochrome c [Phaeovulum veldkampii DSM 11550]
MRRLILIAPFAAALIGGCAMLEPEPTARQDFETFCVACHGTSGKGDGAGAEMLTARPADLTRIAARNGGRYPRAEVMTKIWGYAKGQTGHPQMPAFDGLLAGDTVLYDSGDGIATPTPLRLVQLQEYIEGLQR